MDHLHGDKITLSACSLANKSLRTRSQYILFRTMKITVYGGESSWKAARATNIPSLPFPDKATLVEELHVQGAWHDATVASETLGCLVQCLPQLRVLNISYVHLSSVRSLPGPFTPLDLFDVLPHIMGLRSLSFSDVTCQRPVDLLRPWAGSALSGLDDSSFAQLEELVCDNFYMADRVYQLVKLIEAAHARIAAGQSKSRRASSLRHIMLRLAPTPFHMNDFKTLTFHTCGRLLEIAGSALEHLSLCLSELILEDIAANRDMPGK